MENKTTIEVVAAPAGYDNNEYQFFKDETGQIWKASVELKTARIPMLGTADIEAAPSELAVTVAVSPVDKNGKALREDDRPIISDSHTHTFTNTEMQEPDFDPSTRIMRIVAERIHGGKARLFGVDKINTLVEDWNKKAKLKAGKFTYEQHPESQVLPGVVEIRGRGPDDPVNDPPASAKVGG